MYVPLYCKTNFSFLEGASHPDELVESAARFGLHTLAVTDRDGVYGIVRAWLRARELGVNLVVGSELTLEDGSTLVLLAQDREGYANLCGLITRGRRRCTKGRSEVRWSEVCEHAPGLIALWGGERSLLCGARPLDDALAGTLREAFQDRLYAMLTRHRRADEVMQERRLRERAARHGLQLVAAHEVLYHTPARRSLQDVLTCIRHGVPLHAAGTLIKPNDHHALLPPLGFRELYGDDYVAAAMTEEVAQRCTFSLAELRYVYPAEALPDGASPAEHLRALTLAGARKRYHDQIPQAVAEQLERELALIEELDYGGYFLTMHRLVEYCRTHDILCQGRGSAANSAVCYCLGITAVDPVRMDLLFERFLSRERAEPPDIDLDIEHDRREEVIQHVYEFYGRDHAAMVANVIRFRARSAIREVGKTLGIAQTTLDRLAKLASGWGSEPPEPALLRQAGLDPEQPRGRHFVRLTSELIDFPRHLSIHPGGFLLGHEPVHRLVPIENGAMDARTVIQWDKYDVEALGLFKVDLLGLGMLNQMHRCFDLLREERGLELTMATLPADDEATYEMMGRADTVGVFQIESRAQMSMLPRLKPRNFYDLVIEVSIVRPGPITGGMVHPYLRRRAGEEEVVYPHESLRPVLEKTLGVPLFQEQVMKLAVVAADYTPGEADQLRRDMAAWRRSGRIQRHRARLVSRMTAKGIAREFAERVFEQIRGFGEYGFPESHAASFALVSYATAYLKCHYPVEFTCALLNAQPMGFYSISTLIHDAQRHGVVMLPIDVRRSSWDCTLEALPQGTGEKGIRVGLRFVKGLGSREQQRLEAACREGAFVSLEDFVRRAGLDERRLCALAESGAFEGFGLDRRSALWQVQQLVRAQAVSLPFDGAQAARSRGEDSPIFRGLSALEQLAWDHRTSRHSTRGHLLEPLRGQLRARGLPDAASVARIRHGRRVRYAGIVICRQRPGTARGVTFITLEDETGFVNLVIWADVYERQRTLVRTEPFLGVSGRVQSEHGIIHVVVERLWRPDVPLLDPTVLPESHDFH